MRLMIQDIMEEKHISVDDIVPYMSISRRTIYYIFESRKSPTLRELEEFAKVLNVPIESLYISDYSIPCAKSCTFRKNPLKNN